MDSLTLTLFLFIFHYARTSEDSGIIRELWTNVQGDSLQNLLADARFPHRPTRMNLLSNFDAPGDDDSNYAQRIKGYFFAPQSGEYKFYSSCDGSCEIFLGLHGMEGENNRIISQHQSTKRNEYTRYPEQVSRAITLEKEQLYYIEAINKHTIGEENLSVGVELPNGDRLFPIPRSLLRKSKGKSDIEIQKEDELSNVITPRKSKSRKRADEELVNNNNRHLEIRRKVSDKKDNNNNSNISSREIQESDQASGKSDDSKLELDDNNSNESNNIDKQSNGDKHESRKYLNNQDKEKLKDPNEEEESNLIFEKLKPNLASKSRVPIISSHNRKYSEDNSNSVDDAKGTFTSNSYKETFDIKKELDEQKELSLGTRRETPTYSDDDKPHKKLKTADSKVVFSYDLKTPVDKVDKSSNERVIEANFNSLGKPLATALAQHMKNQNIDVIMPGGKSLKLSNRDKSEDKDSGEEDSKKEENSTDNRDLDSSLNITANDNKISKNVDVKSRTYKVRDKVDDNLVNPSTRSNKDSSAENNDDHGASTNNQQVPANNLHLTGAVAMVPALIHHDQTVVDYETGHISGGGTHIEPLAPVHTIPTSTEATHTDETSHVKEPLLNTQLSPQLSSSDSQAITDIHALPTPLVHNMNNDITPALADSHADPSLMLSTSKSPQSPQAPNTNKPDIIKVEFVPEEITIETFNKSKIAKTSKAGTVRVQFIPGDVAAEQKTRLEQENAATRMNKDQQKDEAVTAGVKDDHKVDKEIATTDKQSPKPAEVEQIKQTSIVEGSPAASSPVSNSLTTTEHKSGEMPATQSSAAVNLPPTVLFPPTPTAVESASFASPSAGAIEPTALQHLSPQAPIEPTSLQHSSSLTPLEQPAVKEKSKNGYEANPSLPFMNKDPPKPPDLTSSLSTPPIAPITPPSAPVGSSTFSGSSSSVTQQGSSSLPALPALGGSGGVGVEYEGSNPDEHIDPPMTALAQKFPDAVNPEIKTAVAADQKTVANTDDHVFFGGGGGGGGPANTPPILPVTSQSQANQGGPLPNEPSPEPSTQAPSQPSQTGSTEINPVASHLMNALDQRTVSPEEALQMMNDFVSGNQDMNKAAKNMEGMLGQISSKRVPKKEAMDGMGGGITPPLPQMGSPQLPQLPQMDGAAMNDPMNPSTLTQMPSMNNMALNTADDEHRFISDPNELSAGGMSNGYVNSAQMQTTLFEGGQHPPVVSNVEHTRPALQFTGTQRDEQHLPPHSPIRNVNQQINSMSSRPQPPVHLYDGISNSNRLSSDHYDSSMGRHFEQNHQRANNMMESMNSNYDSYANPSFHKQQRPSSFDGGNSIGGADMGGNSMSNMLDNPREMMASERNQEMGNREDRARHDEQDNSLIQNTETLPSVDVPNTVSATQGEKLPSPRFMDANNQPVHQNGISRFNANPMSDVGFNNKYNDNEAELPEGHIIQSYPSNNYMDDPNFARKFDTPHAENTNLLSEAKIKEVTGISQPLSHTKSSPVINTRQNSESSNTKGKEQTGHRKHSMLAQIYEDSIFPEDYTDIESLQGSLQGRTLTNFDKTEAGTVRSLKSKPSFHQMVKTTYPIEGNAMGGIAGDLGQSLVRSKVPGSQDLNISKKFIKQRKSAKKKKSKKLKKRQHNRKLSKVKTHVRTRRETHVRTRRETHVRSRRETHVRSRREVKYPHPKIQAPEFLLDKFIKSVHSFNRNQIMKKIKNHVNKKSTNHNSVSKPDSSHLKGHKIVNMFYPRKEKLAVDKQNGRFFFIKKNDDSLYPNIGNKMSMRYTENHDTSSSLETSKKEISQLENKLLKKEKELYSLRGISSKQGKHTDKIKVHQINELEKSGDSTNTFQNFIKDIDSSKTVKNQLNSKVDASENINSNTKNDEVNTGNKLLTGDYEEFIRKNKKMVDVPIIRQKVSTSNKPEIDFQKETKNKEIQSTNSNVTTDETATNILNINDEHVDSSTSMFPESTDWADIKPIGAVTPETRVLKEVPLVKPATNTTSKEKNIINESLAKNNNLTNNSTGEQTVKFDQNNISDIIGTGQQEAVSNAKVTGNDENNVDKNIDVGRNNTNDIKEVSVINTNKVKESKKIADENKEKVKATQTVTAVPLTAEVDTKIASNKVESDSNKIDSGNTQSSDVKETSGSTQSSDVKEHSGNTQSDDVKETSIDTQSSDVKETSGNTQSSDVKELSGNTQSSDVKETSTDTQSGDVKELLGNTQLSDGKEFSENTQSNNEMKFTGEEINEGNKADVKTEEQISPGPEDVQGNMFSAQRAYEGQERGEFDANDKSTLKTLVTELKDVLHNLHDDPPVHNRKPINEENFREESDLYGPPDQYESASRGDVMSAFTNVGRPTNHEVDIESFSQDVWEPGVRTLGSSLDGTFSTSGLSYKRTTLPRVKKHPKKIKKKP